MSGESHLRLHIRKVRPDDLEAVWRVHEPGNPRPVSILASVVRLPVETAMRRRWRSIRTHAGKETDMGAKGEALARQFEAKAHEAGAYIEKLADADLKRVTEAEGWTVAATAHHLFGAYDRVPDVAKALAAGQSPANFSTKVLDQMNAQHAKDFSACSKADVMAAYRAGSAKAASVLRGLSDEELARSGVIFEDTPPFTVEQLVTGALIAHTDEHMGSIRKTVGK